jgi:ankyrin repeat protein
MSHTEVVQLLLTQGADVDAKMDDRRTALTLASEKEHQEVKELLLRAGAK